MAGSVAAFLLYDFFFVPPVGTFSVRGPAELLELVVLLAVALVTSQLAASERPLLACLDQVTDPRNLGAVCRSAEGAGATGVVVPAHGSATVTPAVCRSSAGAVEHLPVAIVPNLARYLADVKGSDLWVYAAAGDGEASLWRTDLTGGAAFVFGAEGKGLRPLVRRTCDAAVSIPLAGHVESLNVSVAAALLLYEARRQRDG